MSTENNNTFKDKIVSQHMVKLTQLLYCFTQDTQDMSLFRRDVLAIVLITLPLQQQRVLDNRFTVLTYNALLRVRFT